MTGYGRSEQIVDGRAVTVEIKSVNHRYFEFSCRTTRGYSFLEEKLKSFLQGRITRGKVDAYISVEALESAQTQVLVIRKTIAPIPWRVIGSAWTGKLGPPASRKPGRAERRLPSPSAGIWSSRKWRATA